jgi:putative acetyltransferase
VNRKVFVEREDPRTPELRALVEELDAYMTGLYPVESNHLLDIETLAQPDMRFFAARVDGTAEGCGALWLHEPDYGEVKRIYVRRTARGFGLAKLILERLEQEARNHRLALLRLETGIRQPEALGLFEAYGFARRGPFGDYPTDDPLSVFMEKCVS